MSASPAPIALRTPISGASFGDRRRESHEPKAREQHRDCAEHREPFRLLEHRRVQVPNVLVGEQTCDGPVLAVLQPQLIDERRASPEWLRRRA